MTTKQNKNFKQTLFTFVYWYFVFFCYIFAVVNCVRREILLIVDVCTIDYGYQRPPYHQLFRGLYVLACLSSLTLNLNVKCCQFEEMTGVHVYKQVSVIW